MPSRPLVGQKGVIMKVLALPVGQLETNCYLLCDVERKLCAVIDPGADADIVVYDPGASHVIRADDCVANVDYNPYEGFVTAGGIRQVWLRGHLAVEDGKVLDSEPQGKYMARGKCSL